MKKHIVGIDLGTSSTLIWISGSDSVVFNEPTVLAWSKKKKEVIEIGYLAHKLIGKVPEDLSIICPIKKGVVADKEAAVSYLNEAFKRLNVEKEIKNASYIISVPSDISKVEKQALIDVSRSLGAKDLYLIDAAKASAIGSGIDVFSTRGNMSVDIGGSATNIATIALGKIVVSKSTFYAGSSVDDAISRFIRTKHHLLIGPKTAEYIKMKIGTLLDNPDNNLLEVSGKDVITGLPHSVIVSTSEISSIIVKIYSEIVNTIIDTLEVSPAEISSDIIHTGITLSGGGCLINGAREFFSKKLSVPVHISPYPLESTIQGIRMDADKIIEDPSESISLDD